MAPQGKNRRRHPRARVNRPVQLHLEETTAYGAVTALNLGIGGICVARAPKARVGERVYCRLIFSGRDHLALPCRVVWTEEVDYGLSTMGLAFAGLGSGAQRMVRQLVKQLRRDHRSTARLPLPDPRQARARTEGDSSSRQWRALAIGVSLGLLAVISVALWRWISGRL